MNKLALLLSSMSLLACGSLAAQPVISCSASNLSVFNTGGVDASGTQRWQIAYVESPAERSDLNLGNLGRSFAPATLISSPTGAWYKPPVTPTSARWIAHNSTGAHGTAIDAFFRFDFTLESRINPSEFAPTLNFYADNSVYEVYVNGVPQSTHSGSNLPQAPLASAYVHDGFSSVSRAASVPLRHNWLAGNNSVVVHVKSLGPAYGFLAQLNGSTPPCPNQAPSATPSIAGSPLVTSLLTGSHSYADDENDLENTAGTTRRWVRSNDNSIATTADNTQVGTATTYTPVLADWQKYLFYCVTPAAQTGQSPGAESCTSVLVNDLPPTASPTISGSPLVGTVLTGSHGYADAAGDLENTAGTTRRWVRSSDNSIATTADNTQVGTATTYTVQPGDSGKFLFYCVTPAAQSGQSPGQETCIMLTGAVSTPSPVPLNPWWSLLALGGLLGGMGLRRMKSVH